MNYLDLLPDKWEETVDYRNNKYKSESLRMMRSKRAMFESCNGCPCFRFRLISVEGYEYVLTSCVFSNKCIKQYPHKVDNKEFK